MKNLLIPGLALSLLCMLASCDKKDDLEGCLGCGIDLTVREFEFKVSGKLKDNCAGDPAAFKDLDFYVFYSLDSLVGTTQTDEHGDFTFTYKKVLPGGYSFDSKWSSLLRLIVREDSTTFFLPGLRELKNLDLTLNDSIDLDIFVKTGDVQLTSSDTISIWFGTSRVLLPRFLFKRAGPVFDQELIQRIYDKWRFVNIDVTPPSPTLNLFYEVRRGGGLIGWGDYPIQSKMLCVDSKDSIVIALP